MPKTAGNSKNAFAVEVGGGADYRFNPRLSGRLQGDWVHTSFFSQSQNNFQLVGGVVFHF
jgi:opacity protein-like surface antigen